MRTKPLSLEAEAWIKGELNKTDWDAIKPETKRMTQWRAQREQLEALARQREAKAQEREAEKVAREETAWLARWTNPGGSYGR
jgi:hypothetical protein